MQEKTLSAQEKILSTIYSEVYQEVYTKLPPESNKSVSSNSEQALGSNPENKEPPESNSKNNEFGLFLEQKVNEPVSSQPEDSKSASPNRVTVSPKDNAQKEFDELKRRRKDLFEEKTTFSYFNEEILKIIIQEKNYEIFIFEAIHQIRSYLFAASQLDEKKNPDQADEFKEIKDRASGINKVLQENLSPRDLEFQEKLTQYIKNPPSKDSTKENNAQNKSQENNALKDEDEIVISTNVEDNPGFNVSANKSNAQNESQAKQINAQKEKLKSNIDNYIKNAKQKAENGFISWEEAYWKIRLYLVNQLRSVENQYQRNCKLILKLTNCSFQDKKTKLSPYKKSHDELIKIIETAQQELNPEKKPKIVSDNRSQEIEIEVNNENSLSEENHLSVATWNILQMFRIARLDKKVAWNAKERRKLIAEFLKDDDYDIIGFQEAFDSDARAEIFPVMERYGFHHHSSVLGSEGIWHNGNLRPLNGGVTILSKWPIIKQSEYVFKNSRYEGGDGLVAKGALYVEIEKDNKGIKQRHHIFVVHMAAQYQEDYAEKVQRNEMGRTAAQELLAEEVKELKRFILQQNIPINEPITFMGDFNFGKDNFEHNPGIAQFYQDMMNELNGTVLEDNNTIKSFDAENNGIPMATGEKGQTLDHIADLTPLRGYKTGSRPVVHSEVVKGEPNERLDLLNRKFSLALYSKKELEDSNKKAKIENAKFGYPSDHHRKVATRSCMMKPDTDPAVYFDYQIRLLFALVDLECQRLVSNWWTRFFGGAHKAQQLSHALENAVSHYHKLPANYASDKNTFIDMLNHGGEDSIKNKLEHKRISLINWFGLFSPEKSKSSENFAAVTGKLLQQINRDCISFFSSKYNELNNGQKQDLKALFNNIATYVDKMFELWKIQNNGYCGNKEFIDKSAFLRKHLEFYDIDNLKKNLQTLDKNFGKYFKDQRPQVHYLCFALEQQVQKNAKDENELSDGLGSAAPSLSHT